MGEKTEIAWTDATFNPWWGCQKISPACDNCYAEAWAKRTGFPEVWTEPGGTPIRRTFGAKHWAQPILWNQKAARAGTRLRVFCASMADVFDSDAPEGERELLFRLIKATPSLDWLLLTKRIGNAKRMLPADWGDGYPNVWLGATIANQPEADRDIYKLLATPAAIRFLSLEPLLGPVDLTRLVIATGNSSEPGFDRINLTINGLRGAKSLNWRGIDWVIVGGESGGHARPFVLGWGKDIVRQCKAAGVSVFMKQVGANPTNREGEPCPHIKDRKGGDPSEWPAELMVREFPAAKELQPA